MEWGLVVQRAVLGLAWVWAVWLAIREVWEFLREGKKQESEAAARRP